MGDFRDLLAYKKAFELAMEIFEVTKTYPTDEKYGLSRQIRNSSRSVCANIAEGYRKRRYEAHFVSKATDADMENSETQVWLDFSLQCGYINMEKHKKFKSESEEVGKLLNDMIKNPKKYK